MTQPTPHLLLVDDEGALRGITAARLRERGYEVVEAETGEKALELLEQFAFDVLVTDLRLPGVDGRQVVKDAVARYPAIVVIVITGFGNVKDALDLGKQGVSDFLEKPVDFERLVRVLDKEIRQRGLARENEILRAELEKRDQIGFAGIIGRSQPMRALFQLLESVAATSSTVLITGETGTGKEVVARAIHHKSERRSHRFVAMNCSAVPEALLEAELFGYVRGAYTGAVGSREGRFEQAHRGTLFLDEVGTMSVGLQMKLLRVLQERSFERLGDNQTVKVDVRVIAATNSSLSRMVAEGTFREDLYYRLNVIPIELPPLRDRRDDIPVLAKHFLGKFSPGAEMRISQRAMRALMAYSWPGNVRQLENALERAVALGAGRREIDSADLPPELQATSQTLPSASVELPEEGIDLPAYVAAIERELIRRALERHNNNRNKAAATLNLKRTTLVEKIKRIGPTH